MAVKKKPGEQVDIKTKRAVVLLSGGLDSATVLAIARREGYELYALSFRYGQRHVFELEAARAPELQPGPLISASP